jgi:hypothetical protein
MFADVSEEHSATIFRVRISQARFLTRSSHFLLFASSPYPLTLNMEAVCSFEMSVNSYRAAGRFVPEGSALQLIKCSSFKMLL